MDIPANVESIIQYQISGTLKNTQYPIFLNIVRYEPSNDTNTDIVTALMDVLEELAEIPEQPFFLAVEYEKPHLPFIFLDEYLDFYREEDVNVPDDEYAPYNIPDISYM